MSDRNRARMVALVALLVLTGIALRGHLPGVDRSTPAAPSHNPAGMIAVMALLGAAIVIITIAIVATLREPRPPRQSPQYLNRAAGGERTRPSMRTLLIVLGVILAWLIVVVLLLQLSAVADLGHPSATSAPSTAAPGASPAPPPPASPPQPPQQPGPDAFWYLFATTMFMLVLWAAGIVVALVRHRRAPTLQPVTGEAAEPVSQHAPHSLAVAAERGLAEMGDLSREPREAIIACYAAMEDALANSPGAAPQDSDTPSEVLARAVDHDAIHAGTATELVDLFAEARFSPHLMNEGHREVAVRALQLVLAELKSPA
jgi:uncharacterized membrane protein YedE/YeeE